MISKRRVKFFALAILALRAVGSIPAMAAGPYRVVVTLPDFIEVVQAVGGDHVEVQSLLSGFEDPHFVDAVPSFVTRVAKADVMCAVGLELEVGWLPKVLSKSANSRVQSGGKGFCELGPAVTLLEHQHGAVNRSMGDVHAGGNPHFHLSPTALGESALAVARVLAVIDPERASLYQANAQRFVGKMQALKAAVAQRLLPLKDKTFLQYHKEFTYFFKEYDLKMSGAIEEKPGVPPSSARLASVAQSAKSEGVILALGATYTSTGHLRKFGELSGVKTVRLPAGVQKNEAAYDSIEKLQNYLASELLR